jgi:hypothetical protein
VSSTVRADTLDELANVTNRNGIAMSINKSKRRYRTLAGSLIFI